jgi:hypothetical protein
VRHRLRHGWRENQDTELLYGRSGPSIRAIVSRKVIDRRSKVLWCVRLQIYWSQYKTIRQPTEYFFVFATQATFKCRFCSAPRKLIFVSITEDASNFKMYN